MVLSPRLPKELPLLLFLPASTILCVSNVGAVTYDGGVHIPTNYDPGARIWAYGPNAGHFRGHMPTDTWFAQDLRSGSPNTTGFFSPPNASIGTGHPITKVTFSFQYVVGYDTYGDNKPSDPDSKFPSMKIYLVDDPNQPDGSGKLIHDVGTLRLYNDFDSCQGTNISCYSPITTIVADGFEEEHADGKPKYVRFHFINNRRNVQIAVDRATGLDLMIYHSPVSQLSIGTILIIVVFFGLLLPYCVFGVAYQKYRKGERGVDLIPNISFWAALPGLIGDGFKFTCYKLCGRDGGSSFVPMSSRYEKL